jgi:acetoin utilization deacetylase AcuC-like enzyme
VTVLLATHPAFLLHDTGPWHPERPARLEAVLAGVEQSGVGDAVVRFEPRRATAEEVERVHPGRYLTALEEFTVSGGGHLDADTIASQDSYEAALLAAGAGLEAIERLDAGQGETAFCAVRPPGHHATPRRPMGFCLINNIAVAATALIERGERVLIVDWDAHHGNGTQDAFYDEPRVVYVSFHEYPLYPGTGSMEELGRGEALGTNVNFPVPAGTTGDVVRAGIDDVVKPLAEVFEPTWLLVSAGYDAHRADPITGLGLQAGDFADLTVELCSLVPAGRRVFFLEGGYDLEGLTNSVGATIASIVGESHRPEPATSGGPGRAIVGAVRRIRDDAGLP